MTDDLLVNLDPAQRAVAQAVRGPVVVTAAAGSGKTRAIAHRIAYAVATAAHVEKQGLALSFTTKAAGELRGRLLKLGVSDVTTATFHSAALRQLSYFWPRVLGGAAWKVVASKTALLETAASQAGFEWSAAVRRAVQSEIEWAKSSGLDATAYAKLERNTGAVDVGAIAEVWSRYTDLCHTRNLIDFEDVLSLTVGLMQQRPDVADEIRRRYSWFTVDEFQDVTPLQRALLDEWLGDRTDVCVVGDPAQTIYSFAGAQSVFLGSFKQTYPDATVVELATTYRCPPAVVTAANSLMQAGGVGFAMKAAREVPGGFDVRGFADEQAEAAQIAADIKALIDAGTDPRDISVLLRINSQTVPFEAALDTVHVPYTLRGGQRFFERREVKQVLLQLRAMPPVPAGMSLSALVRDVANANGMGEFPVAGDVHARSSWEALSALVALAGDVERGVPNAGPIDLFEEVARRTIANDEPAAAAVTLSTIHSAKGLEWDHVFVPSVNQGLLPFGIDPQTAEIEEERRLLYVAITRARVAAHVSYVATRNGSAVAVSPFIADLGSTATLVAADSSVRLRPEPVIAASRVAVCGSCGRGLVSAVEIAMGSCENCPVEVPPALEALLLAWRDDRAHVDGVQPWLVLTDLTVRALALHRPQNAAELAQISGMNPAKLAAYAREILAIITPFAK